MRRCRAACASKSRPWRISANPDVRPAAYVVEAQRLFLPALCALIERAGARLVGADTLVDLDDVATTECDILVIDLDDSDYDIVESVEVVREELPDVAVFVLTRHLDGDRVTAISAAGAAAVIGKTQPPDDVESRLRAAMCGERIIDVRTLGA